MMKLYYLISGKEGEEEENAERRGEVEISLVCRGSRQKEYPQKKGNVIYCENKEQWQGKQICL
jgi:hypothetical protein